MAKYKDIRAALETTLQSVTGIIDIDWQNSKYTPTTGTPYLKAYFLPTSRRPATLGQEPITGVPYQHKYLGLFQLVLYYPENQGTAALSDMVETIIDAFDSTKDLTFNTTSVTIDNAEQEGSYEESPWIITPINIYWYCYDT